MTNEEFVNVVKETIESLPEEFRTKLENIVIMVEERPMHNLPLLGQYQGTPQTQRFAAISLPSRITIYKLPLLTISKSLDDARKNIRETVLHEIGHHFGLTEEDLTKIKEGKSTDAASPAAGQAAPTAQMPQTTQTPPPLKKF